MAWNPEAVQELLDAGYVVVVFRDGVGDITVIAAEEGTGDHPIGVYASAAVQRWQGSEAVGVFDGPNKFSGAGKTVAQALECVTEKVLRDRLPKGDGQFYEHGGES